MLNKYYEEMEDGSYVFKNRTALDNYRNEVILEAYRLCASIGIGLSNSSKVEEFNIGYRLGVVEYRILIKELENEILKRNRT